MTRVNITTYNSTGLDTKDYWARCSKSSEVDYGYWKSILGPVTRSPVRELVERTRRSPAKGRLWWRNVILYRYPLPDWNHRGSRRMTVLTAGDDLKAVPEEVVGPVQVKKDALICQVWQMKEDDLDLAFLGIVGDGGCFLRRPRLGGWAETASAGL